MGAGVGCRTQVTASRDSVGLMSGRGGGFGRLGTATGSTGAAAPRRSGGGGGGWRGFGGAAGPIEKLPKERRDKTLRRMLGFFPPYRAQIAVVLVTIVAHQPARPGQPVPAQAAHRRRDPRAELALLTLYVGLMIILPIVSGLIGVGQSYLNNVIGQRVMQDLRNALYTHLQRCRCASSPRRGPARSRAGWPTTSAASRPSSPTRRRHHVATSVAVITIVAMFLIDWRLTLLSLGLLPFFMYLTYRVGKVPRDLAARRRSRWPTSRPSPRRRCQRQRHPADQDVRPAAGGGRALPRANAKLAALQIRQAMVGRWFFMIVGTVFSITPALVYWLAGYLAITERPVGADDRRHRRLHDAPDRGSSSRSGQLLNVQVEVQGALALFDRIFEYLDLTRRDRGRARRRDARADRRPRPHPLPPRLLPLPPVRDR